MKGLELSRRYYEKYGKPMLETFPEEYRKKIAVGLAGEGSECFGFDDEISQDHDFGPGFCVWMPENIDKKMYRYMVNAYDRLPKVFKGYKRTETEHGAGRIGIMTVESFYKKFIGIEHAPENNLQWLGIPEHFIATAVNGQVFEDNCGDFSNIRDALMAFYPEDVVKKKLAARVAVMAQSGQYNYGRALKRGDIGGAYMACGEFVRAALSAVYLLNKRYMPFYKWAFRGAEELDELKNCVKNLNVLIALEDKGREKEKLIIIEDICCEVAQELKRRNLSFSNGCFLMEHGEEIMKQITDVRLAEMHIMTDCAV